MSRASALTIRNPSVFISLLVAATFAPPLFLIVSYGLLEHPIALLSPAYAAIGFLGSAHVIITVYFYFDQRAKGLIAASPAYYLGIPLLLLVLTPLAFLVMGDVTRHLAVVAFYLSAFWHHARQNVGIYSFMSRSYRFGKMSDAERRVITYSFAGSIFAAIRWYDGSGLLKPYYPALYEAAVACFAIVGTAAAWVAWKEYQKHRNPARTVLFLVLAMMFLPSILFNSWIAGLSWSSAHGLQYWLFLYYLAYRDRGEAPVLKAISGRWILAGAVLALIWPAVLLFGISKAYMWTLGNFPDTYNGGIDTLVFGLVMGWVLTHYVVDAKMWRMSDPKVRAYHQGSFGFI